MHPLVKEYLEKKDAEKAEEKSKLLLRLGLYEKEYTDNKERSFNYPFAEHDETGAVKYYKKVPVEISDEDYAELLKYQNGASSVKNTENPIANAFRAVAVITYIAGFATGLLFGNVDYGRFSFAVAFTYWAIGFISGMTFLGFGEIIQLLTDIKNK